MDETQDRLDVAIVGMAGIFPGAKNVREFWQLLRNGVEAVTFFTDEELIEAGVDPALVKDPNYVKSRAIIEDEDKFDAGFFDLPPREVEMMDPQHRLFLQTAWHALEDAGYDPDRYDGLIGLFGGVSMNTYLFSFLTSGRGRITSAEGYQLSIGNDKDFLTTRVSYKLNLKGPSVAVQTACSTSLVAVHLAYQSLLDYTCDMALAGGVSITIPQKQGYYYQEGMILSKDGHCRAFDHRASGTISGTISGVQVTLYSDTHSGQWLMWDAWNYDQVNPQTTLDDGYYSFYTPPGTYRVMAEKNGYPTFTSPNLAVVDKPVRHNVPLGYRWVYLMRVNLRESRARRHLRC